MSHRSSSRALWYLALAAAAGGGFAVLARAVAQRDTAAVDHEVHDRMAVPKGEPAREAAEASSPIGKWWTYVPAGVLTALYVVGARGQRREGATRGEQRGSRALGAAAIVTSATLAASLNHLFDRLLPQPPAPPGRPREHPVFPSGHAFGTTTVAMTAACVLSREKLVSPLLAFPLAFIVPAGSSLARLVEEKHWISDIAGGWLAAFVVASLPLAAYEAASARAGHAASQHPRVRASQASRSR